jgi:hypothetical protein
MGVKWKTAKELQREITDEEQAARILNRLAAFGLSEQEEAEKEVPELSMPKIKALEVVLDRIKPKLSSADITAHSSPQIESEEALVAQLQALIAKYPHLISQLQATQPAIPTSLPQVGAIDDVGEDRGNSGGNTISAESDKP